MKIQEIRTIAKEQGIKTGNLIKPELIRAIQKSEGNFDCYGSATSEFCDQVTNAAISKATLMSFPLVGNLSEKPRRIADKPQ